MATAQIAVRLPKELIEALDELIESGRFDSRTAAVRRGLRLLLELEERKHIDQAIVEGYTRIPQTEEEIAWAHESARESIAEEPW